MPDKHEHPQPQAVSPDLHELQAVREAPEAAAQEAPLAERLGSMFYKPMPRPQRVFRIDAAPMIQREPVEPPARRAHPPIIRSDLRADRR